MKTKLDKWKTAGKIVKANEGGESMSDAELRAAIIGTEVALAYLEGRGTSFDLAIRALRRDLSLLEGYLLMRKL